MRPVTGQSIDKEVVDSLIPSLGLGVILPTALMLWPFENKTTSQKFVALWQPVPVYAGLLTAGISFILRKQRTSTTAVEGQSKTSKDRKEMRKQKEATHSVLRSVYVAGTATAALIHLWSLYRISSSSDLSFSGVFGKIGELVTGSYGSDPESRIFGFLQRDMFLNAASVFTHNLYRILQLRTSGYVTNKEALGASLALVVAQPVLGPAAAHIGLLGWREEVFMRINRRISVNN
jgi:hypothetical protein